MPLAAQAATYTIDGTAGKTWADIAPGDALTLNTNDVLNILPAAGNPATATTILVSTNSTGVQINGNSGTYTDMRVVLNPSASATIDNLNLDGSGSLSMITGSSLTATGTSSVSAHSILSHALFVSSSTTLTVPAGSTLILDKLAANGDPYPAVWLTGGTVTFAVDGTLNITSHNDRPAVLDQAGSSTTINKTGAGTMTVTKDGVGEAMQCAVLNVNAGTLTSVNTATGGVTAGLSMISTMPTAINVAAGATLNVMGSNANNSYGIQSVPSLAITNNGTMTVTGGLNSAAIQPLGTLTLTMGVGAVTTLTNNAAAAEQHPFTMGAASTWQLTGSAAFVAPSTATSSPATITVPAATSGTITLNGPAGAPTITIGTQPAASTTVTQGAITGSLSVAASVMPAGALTYQWYSNTTNNNTGGTAITGATSASFTLPATLTAAGSPYYYYCVVSAIGAADVASDVAQVTVNAPATVAPTIVTPAGALADATAGTAYSATLAASNSPTGWALATGAPAWLSISNTGVLSGTPPAAAAGTTVSFSVTASNAAGASAPVSFTITIRAPGSGNVTVTSVPTLGEWALALLALLLGGTALTMRRKG